MVSVAGVRVVKFGSQFGQNGSMNGHALLINTMINTEKLPVPDEYKVLVKLLSQYSSNK